MQTSNEWWYLRRRKDEVVLFPCQRRTCSPLLECWRIHMLEGLGTKKLSPGYQSPISSPPQPAPCLDINDSYHWGQNWHKTAMLRRCWVPHLTPVAQMVIEYSWSLILIIKQIKETLRAFIPHLLYLVIHKNMKIKHNLLLLQAR